MTEQENDPVAKAMEEIQKIEMGYLSNKFLNTVGDVLEKEGRTMTENFLRERRSRRDTRQQAEVLLKVLDILKRNPSIDRKTGRFIIKGLNSIKRKEIREND